MSKFEIGQEVVITAGEWRGCYGVIDKHGMVDWYYWVKMESSPNPLLFMENYLAPVKTRIHYRCPVCCQYVEVIKGLLISHNNKRVECYGSFMPMEEKR